MAAPAGPGRPDVPPARPVRPALPQERPLHPIHPAVPPTGDRYPVVPHRGHTHPTVPQQDIKPGGTLAPAMPGAAIHHTAYATARLASDWRTWRFLPAKALDRRYPAGRWTVTATAHGAGGEEVTARTSFWLRRETRLTSAEAVPAGGGRAGKVRVRGVLTRVDPKGLLDYAPFPEQEVVIEFRRPDGVQWTRLAIVTTDRRGRFARTVSAPSASAGTGRWRVRYTGSGRYAGKIADLRSSPQR
ncbi:hypothetical protein C1I98_29585 [Spongiactinospora gelatinilytica]|uniref:Htaa domain-containing protein n=2 Tax=Spongiactinospora gelatinilytica TaxID=2666298 RepID=A0A2W2GDD2_9ACTN|nr:hypothetical protein C1I98_29585 [Spongiactinospora gelatinilytica]